MIFNLEYSDCVAVHIDTVNVLQKIQKERFNNLEETFKKYEHNPPHLFRQNAKYFITGSTYFRKHYLESDAAKEKTLEFMFKSFEHFGWKIEDWVLLNNHYHVMAEAPEDATTMSNLINNFHKFSALWIKKHIRFEAEPQHIWYNYRRYLYYL